MNTLVKSKSSFKQFNTNTVEAMRLIVFTIGNVKLALPIETVAKVVNQAAVYGNSLDGVGIAHVGDREVTVIDMQQQLFRSSLLNEASQARYLIVVQNTEGELFGIPVALVPTLMQVPFSSIRVLPNSYRHAEILRSATHVCHISQEEAPLTIFLLDVNQLLLSV